VFIIRKTCLYTLQAQEYIDINRQKAASSRILKPSWSRFSITQAQLVPGACIFASTVRIKQSAVKTKMIDAHSFID
jgi:hypothetical protein